MKKIYTSNYARKGADLKSIAISAWPPEWYEGRGMNIFAPKRELVKSIIRGEMDIDHYLDLYIQQLEETIDDPQKLIDEIPDGSYLLCYEKPTDICHRHVLRKWLYEKTGFQMEEWKNEKEQQEAKQQDIVESLLDM